MNLNDALLCMDCSELFSVSEKVCPACSGRTSFPIAPWLNRTKLEKVFYIRGNASPQVSDVARYRKEPA